jgi:hypothetical protein
MAERLLVVKGYMRDFVASGLDFIAAGLDFLVAGLDYVGRSRRGAKPETSRRSPSRSAAIGGGLTGAVAGSFLRLSSGALIYEIFRNRADVHSDRSDP